MLSAVRGLTKTLELILDRLFLLLFKLFLLHNNV